VKTPADGAKRSRCASYGFLTVQQVIRNQQHQDGQDFAHKGRARLDQYLVISATGAAGILFPGRPRIGRNLIGPAPSLTAPPAGQGRVNDAAPGDRGPGPMGNGGAHEPHLVKGRQSRGNQFRVSLTRPAGPLQQTAAGTGNYGDDPAGAAGALRLRWPEDGLPEVISRAYSTVN
jgi:hypothetical protein